MGTRNGGPTPPLAFNLQPSAMIRLSGVCKSYAGRMVLHPLDMEVPAGRSLALVGPSGCGKSTLLRLMLGLIPPDAGTVTLRDRPMTGEAVLRLRHEIGYVIQDGGLFPHLTARENVCLLRQSSRLAQKKTNRATRVDELPN